MRPQGMRHSTYEGLLSVIDDCGYLQDCALVAAARWGFTDFA